MNSRERVLTDLKRTGVPDRVPLEFDLCRQLTDAFGAKLGIPVNYTTSYFEDVTYRISANELRTAMGSDCVVVGASLPRGYAHPHTPQGYVVNEFGMVMRQGALYMEVVEAPLATVSSEAEVMAFPFPDPLADGRFDDAEEYINMYRNEYFLIGDLELTMFEMSWHMVGLEKFLIDLASGEDYCTALFDRVRAFTTAIGKRLVDLGVDALWFGDDVGAQNGMMLSPGMWRSVFKPRYAEMFQEFKHANPNVLIMFHTDGAVAPILKDLAEIGVDVLNPVQPNVPGHDPKTLKDTLGDKLAFFGAIDEQHLLPNGSAAEIEADVAEKIRVLGNGGGYMCAPAHVIQSDVSIENVESFIAAVKKHGVYS